MFKFIVLSLFCGIVVGQMTQAMRDRILKDHNDKRRTATNAANMIELRYDMALEQVAQNYLNRGCSGGFRHNPNRGCDYTARGGRNGGSGSCGSVGENWYSGYTDNTQGVDVVIGGAVSQWTDGTCSSWASPPLRCGSHWCSEKQNFYQSGYDSYGSCTQFSGQTLHYTQVMWATTTHVGCGYTPACGTLCNYAPAGNMNLPSMGSMRESNIWRIGGTCSACPSGYGTCNNGLCSASSATITSCPADTTNKPTNGAVGTCGTSTAVGSTCTQTCNSGYRLTSGSLTRTCSSSGTLSGVTAVCSPTAVSSCPADTYNKPTNGAVGTCGTSTAVGSTCTQTCNSGYRLTSGSLTRTCSSSGTLSGVTAVCSRVYCPGDPAIKPVNGAAGTCTSTYYVGQSCTQRCNAGYELTYGSLTSQCQPNGQYSAPTGVCTAIPVGQATGAVTATVATTVATIATEATLTEVALPEVDIPEEFGTPEVDIPEEFGTPEVDTPETAALETDFVTSEEAAPQFGVCFPDPSHVPANGGAGTCDEPIPIGSTCTQTCNENFTLRSGTSLVRECTAAGLSPSTAVCE